LPSSESDYQERMDALSGALARLVRRQDETDRRLQEIEKALGIARAPVPQPALAPSPPPPVETPSPLPPPVEKPGFETNVGLAWINRIAVVTSVLFVAFVFKYASDSGWIDPTMRVILGVVCGLLTVGIADRTWRGGQKTYAQGVSGLGVAILYLSFYAAFGLYHLIAPGFAFLLMGLATAMGAALALRYDAQAIAALGLLGGFATPVLLSTGQDRPWVLFSWVLLLNAGALAAGGFGTGGRSRG
jgi:Predicted membrane protein